MSEGISIEPGREEEFRYLQGWLAFSDRLDRMIEATEPASEPEQAPAPAPVLTAAAQPAAVEADVPRQEPPRRRRRVLGPLLRGAGQALRRIGEGLEAWGGAPPARGKGASYQPGLHGGG
jgi:hypothetical protein